MTIKRFRIQIIGGNIKEGKQPQAYIALPMRWFDAHALKKGDELEVSYDVDKDILCVSIPADRST